ncbi:hypothetical protein L3Q82_005197 [Scortum barcoo]|uniref:Uncharacterized protein n=1 Tax=Scortum barcoo TaxID=214431 RepID=A0ACB8VA04_9TELE|nr:hypothetical protein L3Q82_005197 [Scortum barcoo]
MRRSSSFTPLLKVLPDEANRTTSSAKSRDEILYMVPKLDSLWFLANMHWEQRPNSTGKGPPDPMLVEHPPQNTTFRDMIECLLQIHKAHVDWLGKLPINPQAPCGGYRAGPVFHDLDENLNLNPPESEVRLTIGRILLSSTLA